MKAGTERCDLL